MVARGQFILPGDVPEWPEPGIPQVPGSVVEATLEHQGKSARRVLLRRPLATGYEPHPWVSHQDVCDRAYWSDGDLTDIIVIYNAETEN